MIYNIAQDVENASRLTSENLQSNYPPKRRIVLLTAFLACLSFIVVIINAVVNFLTNILQNKKVWDLFSQYQHCFSSSNETKVS